MNPSQPQAINQLAKMNPVLYSEIILKALKMQEE
jgi:hypothetical protein